MLRHEDLGDLSFTDRELEAIRLAEGSGVLRLSSNSNGKRNKGRSERRTGRWLGVLVFLALAAYGVYRLAALILK